MPQLSQTSTQYKFLLGSSAITFAIGLTIALRRVSRQKIIYPFFKSNMGFDPHFSPVLHAAKALAIGTALCFGSATVIVGAGSYLLDVHDLPAFSHKMRSIMRQTPLHKQLASDLAREKSERHDDVREWDMIWEEGSKIDAERAEYKRLKKERARAKKEE